MGPVGGATRGEGAADTEAGGRTTCLPFEMGIGSVPPSSCGNFEGRRNLSLLSKWIDPPAIPDSEAG